MNPSDEARDYVSAALSIISNQVRVERGLTSIRGAGSEGRVMEAVRSLKKAHDLQPTNATIHFAYASSLRLAMKGQDALAEIQRVVEFHPQLALARFTREAWAVDAQRAPTLFEYPEWTTASNSLPSFYAEPASGSMLWAAREGIHPRAAFLEKDADGWWSAQKLQGVSIELAVVFSTANPQVAGIDRKCSGAGLVKPDIQESLVVLGIPKSDNTLAAWLYLCEEDSVNVAITGQMKNVVLNKRIPLSEKSRTVISQVRDVLLRTEGKELSQHEWLSAVQRYQSVTDLDRVQQTCF
jgi:hypothetical protein